MRLYEGMFILDDARCAEDYNGTVEKLHEILKQRGAEVVDSRKWEERKLAYPIRRHHRGVYVLIHFNAPTDAIGGIERQMRLASDIVLRDIIVVDEDGITMGAEKEAAKAAAAVAAAAAPPAAPAEAPAAAPAPAPAPAPAVGEQKPQAAAAEAPSKKPVADSEPAGTKGEPGDEQAR